MTPRYTIPCTTVEVVFVGTGARERLPWLEAVTKIPNIKRRIHGNSWDRIRTPGWEKQMAVIGNEYCRAVSGAGVVLGLLRAANHDQSTDRSYEIGAIGGCGLYQDTEEHRLLLAEYPKEGFFKDPADLTQRVQTILESTDLQEELRKIGAQAIRKPQNTYAARLQTILHWAEQ